MTRADTDILDHGREHFEKDPVARKIFLRVDGTALEPGDRLMQKDLAATFARIAERGTVGSYEGASPKAIPPPGCSFHPRCPFANERCRRARPELRRHEDDLVACHAGEEGKLPAAGVTAER